MRKFTIWKIGLVSVVIVIAALIIPTHGNAQSFWNNLEDQLKHAAQHLEQQQTEKQQQQQTEIQQQQQSNQPAAGIPQNLLGPMPHTPDLLGIYIGMAKQAAEDQLQKHSSKVYVETMALPYDFDLRVSDPTTSDTTTVYLTQAPNDLPTVWRVTRDWYSAPSEPGMTLTALLSALRAKYGHETMHKIQGGTTLFWIFDQNGQLRSHADPALMGCGDLDFVEQMHSPTGYGACSVMDTCAKHFFAITASYTAPSPNNPVIHNYHVALANLPYAVKACQVTADAKNAAANRARQEQLKRANQNKPTF